MENTDYGYKGRPGEQIVSDPLRIRALAHPLRLRLLSYLEDTGQSTATQCAEALGESVASCSYHLRQLGKYDYIEQVQQPGRDKPWKAVSRHRSMVPDATSPGSYYALSALAAIEVDAQMNRIRNWIDAYPQQPTDDIEVSSVMRHGFYATHAELLELRSSLHRLTDKFQGRQNYPETRPDGAVQANLFAVLNIEPKPGEPTP